MRPRPSRVTDAHHRGFRRTGRNVNDQPFDFPAGYRLEVFGYGFQMPAIFIRVWIDIFPSVFNKADHILFIIQPVQFPLGIFRVLKNGMF